MIKSDDEKANTIAMLKGHGLQSTRTKEKTIENIVFQALMDASNNISRKPRGVPGELIKSLSKETRDILSDCKSKDWNHRMDK